MSPQSERVCREPTKKVYIDKQERIKPNSSSNHNIDEPDIHVAKLKQEIQRKVREQEARKAEILKGVKIKKWGIKSWEFWERENRM